MKILVVDDEPLFCELIVAELANCGYHDVWLANSGAEAMNRIHLASTPFDCALLDIDMPGIDGVELCALLRSDPVTAAIPVIMVTSRSEMESVDKAFAAGATDYLNKPINRLELQGRMTMATGMTRERKAREVLSSQNDQKEEYSFEDPCRLEIDYSCLDYLAMQNYVLKIGSMKLFSHTAIGFQLAYANEMFLALGSGGFRDTLSDVAEIIAESLTLNAAIISYAGSGGFIVLINRHPEINMEDLTSQIEDKLLTLNSWYAELGQMPVRLDVGAPFVRGLISLVTPLEVLEKALENTKNPVASLGGASIPGARAAGQARQAGKFR
ncbi:response regulator receiver modulated serine phosphatase [Rhodobacteraceae bacterium KLH11]|nr:response regulator receiver modulated serine phosphatase [Rhodobacteraceae bacterium KLH11]